MLFHSYIFVYSASELTGSPYEEKAASSKMQQVALSLKCNQTLHFYDFVQGMFVLIISALKLRISLALSEFEINLKCTLSLGTARKQDFRG